MISVFNHKGSFRLESGTELASFHLAYSTYGKLNEARDNVTWIFHALTANSEAEEWWPGLTGEGRLFDPAEQFIICVNIPGSCYGSIGPLDNNPVTGDPYFHDFPFFTTRDMVRAYDILRKHLGINKIQTGIGGSMGGQQLLEWAIEDPLLFDHIVLLASNARHSPWGIAFNASQRLAIETDPTWLNKETAAGETGMKTARSIALLSYRNYQTYQLGQSETTDKISDFRSESYQRYQGEKLAKRFNAFSYYFLSKSMDAHSVGRSRGGIVNALQLVTAKTLVISISSDILFPPGEQQFIAEHITGASYTAIDSDYGHDGFLLEYEKIENAIRKFNPALNNTNSKKETIKNVNA